MCPLKFLITKSSEVGATSCAKRSTEDAAGVIKTLARPSLENRATPLILATRVGHYARNEVAGCRDPLSREAVRLGACSSRGLFSRALGTLILPGDNLASRLTRSYIAASMMEGRFPDLAARDDI